MDCGRCAVNDLLAHLCEQHAKLVGMMADALETEDGADALAPTAGP